MAAIDVAMAQTAPTAVREAIEKVYESGRYQSDMPQERPLPDFKPLKLPDAVKEILRIFFITLLVVASLLLLFFLANAFPSLRARLRRRTIDDNEAAVGALATDADRERLNSALAEADGLASREAYGEALHLLLLYCLNELRRRFGFGLPASLTSREILGLSVLPELRRHGLSAIVSAVEISYFGGRPVDGATYRRCRQKCEDVVLGGAAA